MNRADLMPRAGALLTEGGNVERVRVPAPRMLLEVSG